jgi:hypothetical protein
VYAEIKNTTESRMPITSLTATGRLALYIMRANPQPQSALALAEQTGSTALTMTRTLQWLCRHGHVERVKVGARTFYTVGAVSNV